MALPAVRPHMVIDPTGIVFLLIVCAGVPYLALQSNKRLGNRPLPMSRRRFFVQSMVMQLLLLAIAVVAAARNGVRLLGAPRPPALSWGAAALLLAFLVGVVVWRWPRRDAESKARVYRLLPHDRGELALYFALCLAAGVCEETAYRGVAAALLIRITGNWLVAVLIASVVFALAHAVQGRRAVVAVFAIANLAHIMVLLTQSLFPVMAVHAIYDAIAGVYISRRYEREVRSAEQSVLSQPTLIR